MNGFWENPENGHFGPKIVLLAPFPWKQEFSQIKWPCQILALIVLKHYRKFQKKVVNGFWENPENGHFGPKIVLLAPFPWKQEFSQIKWPCQILALIVLKHYRKFQKKVMNGFWENPENGPFWAQNCPFGPVSMETRIFIKKKGFVTF